jgi:hypothetical protein
LVCRITFRIASEVESKRITPYKTPNSISDAILLNEAFLSMGIQLTFLIHIEILLLLLLNSHLLLLAF